MFSNISNSNTIPTRRIKNAINEIAEIERRQQQRNGDESDEDVSMQEEASKMLNVTISTILLLASGHTAIPVEYYMWSELFLKSVKVSFKDFV